MTPPTLSPMPQSKKEELIQYGDDMDYLGQQVADSIAGILTANRGHGEQRLVRNMQRLATTIPADQIRNAGQPVFPALRTWLRSVGADRLLPLVNAREAYGITKYGQTLKTNDGRSTDVEIINEEIDKLAYGMKAKMQHPKLDSMINDAMLASVDAACMWLDVIEAMIAQPLSREEIDAAIVNSQELKRFLKGEDNGESKVI